MLALLLICMLVVSVSAAGVISTDDLTGIESSGRAIHLPDIDSGEGTLLFSMTATEVRQFLASESSGKTFSTTDLGSGVESVFYSGRVYSATAAAGGGYRITVGIGYNSWHDGVFTVKDSIQIRHGEYFGGEDTRIDASEFNRKLQYYAFIKNEFTENELEYAWGDVYVYASSIPC